MYANNQFTTNLINSNSIEICDQFYEHIIISGSNPYDRGVSYGRQVKQKIIANIDYYKNCGIFDDWPAVRRYIDDHYVSALKQYYPSGLAEMEGIANGADCLVEDIIMLNARYDLSRWSRHLNLQKKQQQQQPQECTGAVCLSTATNDGDVLIGQNWDINRRIMVDNIAVLLEIYPDPDEGIAPFFMFTEAGQLGRSGMNANGLGLVAMGLFASDEQYDDNGAQYLPVTLLRRMFIEAPSFSVALKRVTWLPRHVAVNMLVATAEDEAINIELTATNVFISYPSIKTGIYTHSNHFKSKGYLCSSSGVKDINRFASSLFRDRQLEKELTKRWPNIDDQSFVDSFKNHLGYPDSLCLHVPNKGKERSSTSPNECTVANIVYNLTKRTVRLCKGSPCAGVYREYRFSKSITNN
ncbi:uncharacterized protein LOC128962747 [Oppia nitens]|uniref:uncharacterized protein LOC128962747 n=1 Tax=Oppia nitens TaxID=1686743 RepID=UPI0023DC8BF6|nr:uncharacterized protein LOC128962747 [Oppia nitens]